MGIFGKKHHWSVGKFAHKVSIKNIKKFAKKASHVAHKTLSIADKATGVVQNISKVVAKGATKLSGVPVIGSVAGIVATGARQAGTVARSAHKGVKGLEKATSAIEHQANHSIHTMETKSKPIRGTATSSTMVSGGNPLKKKEENLF